MGTFSLRTALFALAAFSSQTALAQVQQGYSSAYGTPDVQVDRSVLEDLKGYQPPPMFAVPTPPEDTVTIPTTAAPPLPAPSLTAPKAEDVLNYPVENLHVLTEHNSSLEQKAPKPSDNALPVPTGNATPRAAAPAKFAASSRIPTPPLPAHKPTNLTDLGSPKSAPPEIITVPTPTHTQPQTDKASYKPKAEKLMPAVPPVKVEKSELASQLPPPVMDTAPVAGTALPSLPPTTTNESKKTDSKPSIGERLMDMALMRNIESDEDAIKEKLADSLEQPAEKAPKEPTTPQQTKAAAPQDDGLRFAKGIATLNAEQENQLKAAIIPRASKETQSRIQILAFASPTDGTESSARRVSLSRALAVRDYLLTQKIDASRIDVRALANQGTGETVDRVDIVFVKP